MNSSSENRRVYAYSGGFFFDRRIRRILKLSGNLPNFGLPDKDDFIAIWGNSPTAHRGRKIAEKRSARLLNIEDAFLRSLHPGRMGEAPLGLCIDPSGPHFDPSKPSELEHLLASHPLDDTGLLDRARAAIDLMKEAHLTKYSAVQTDLDPPPTGYVLVIDQTRDDASVKASKADRGTFLDMLTAARLDHPDARIIIKTHPETQHGLRQGYFEPDDAVGPVEFYDAPISPWLLFEHARAVYTVSSQLGFEAIFADHKPKVWGQPFYAGWGLTDDFNPVARRTRKLTKAQLFAAAMILYPTWYDPYRDRLCEVEDVILALSAKARAWREDRQGYTAKGMRLWKRGSIARFFGEGRGVQFKDSPKDDRPVMCWGTTHPDQPAIRVEDGFIRSRGLGANLVPALSLIRDETGLYYDPSGPSLLETEITRREKLSLAQERRAENLINRLIAGGITKYNLDLPDVPHVPEGHRILVVGQVEDDASVRLGCPDISTNQGLLQAARAAHPDAVLIYKPHPDVEAGLRQGAVDAESADVVARHADPLQLLDAVDEVWTMTSLLGFEALLRKKPVTCAGMPFYAGWGLTTDLAPAPDRRTARPTLYGLVHAALIDAPRYRDPDTGLPCPVEVIVERLESGYSPAQGPLIRMLSKLQGLFASQSWLWR